MLRQVIIFAAIFAAVQCNNNFGVIFQWKYMNYTWPSVEAMEKAIHRSEYKPSNNAITGIKVWKGYIYLSIPRFKPGVPVTLARIPKARSRRRRTNPLLKPFPNWEMQKIGNCKAFQYVQSMEIDPLGRMWVLDSGRVNILTPNSQANCPPRLVIFDLENNSSVLRTFEFPKDVADRKTVFLNDIVLDHEDGGYAYITDTSDEDPGIIVYSLMKNTSWKVRHESMKAQSKAIRFKVNGTIVSQSIAVDGIALSPASVKERMVYYTPVSSFNLYSIPAAVLKSRTENIHPHVKKLGRRTSQTDGLVMSASGILYFGLLADDAVAYWNSTQRGRSNYLQSSFAWGQKLFAMDHTHLQWPDTFGFDENGNLWFVTNRLQNLISKNYNIYENNFRVIKSHVKSKNYQYYDDGSAPSLPCIAMKII